MNIGDYVRTKNGYLWKPKTIDDETSHWVLDEYYWYKKEDVKSSPNIEDLISVGDLMFLNIANKKEAFKDLVVPRIAETENELQRYLDKLNNGEFALKGILTKEQIENGVYWVNE